jgi:riboflavin biosynthesis pyrimidine reductase
MHYLFLEDLFIFTSTKDVMMQFLHSQFGVQILLHEGPTLFGQFLAAEAVDELFLTLSPQIAGRAERTNRPRIVQGAEFAPISAPW